MLYTFQLPTTGAITLAQCFRTDFQQMLVNGDGARSLVRDALKRAKRQDQPDYLSVVKAIEEYLPFVFTISDLTQQIDVLDFKTSWKLPSAKSIESKTDNSSFEFERGMVLLTYSLALFNLANDAINRDSENKWKLASSYLLKAESILMYLNSHPVNVDRLPLDLQSTTITGLISACQGASHLLILLKSSDSSPSLLSRVSIYAAEKLLAAQNLKIDSDFKNWLVNAHCYCVASTQRYMAMDNASKNNVGIAIAYLQAAESTLTQKKHRQLTTKPDPMIVQLKQTIASLMNDYKAENDRLAFQPVPKAQDLPNYWPSGRPVTTVSTPWCPPKPLVTTSSSLPYDYSNSPNTSGSQYY